MDNFFRYFFQDIGRVFRAFIDVFVSLGNFFNYLINFPMRMKIIEEYPETFVYYSDVKGVRGNFRWNKDDIAK